MKKIYVSDISIRAFAESRNGLSFREKLDVAQLLDMSGVDAVELPAISNMKEDMVVCRTLTSAMKNVRVCIPAGESDESLEAAWACVKDTKDPCVQIILPTSTVQMEYIYHLKAPKMLEKLGEMCKKAAALCGNVEFVARDASRAENGFVADCCKVAEANGATAVTLCDDSGVYFPADLAAAVKEIKAVCNLAVYVCPSNALNMAAACAVEAVRAGADGVKTSVCGDYLSADVLADIFRVKSDELGAEVSLDVTAIHDKVNKISVCETVETEVEVSVDTEGVCLSASSTIADVSKVVRDLGYELSDVDNGKVYEEFKRVVQKKESIGTRELEAIVASSAMQVPSTFHVVNYVINSGNIITATASITLEKNGETLSGVSTGDGPIDAAFRAIEGIIGHRYELDDFQIQSVTKGQESLGSALIRLRAEGKLYAGNGVSTDIIGACVRAYINALNKIVYEEE